MSKLPHVVSIVGSFALSCASGVPSVSELEAVLSPALAEAPFRSLGAGALSDLFADVASDAEDALTALRERHEALDVSAPSDDPELAEAARDLSLVESQLHVTMERLLHE